MFKKLVPLAIIASSVACMANAETKINVSYLSNNIKVGSLGKISADGYGVGIVFDKFGYLIGINTFKGY